MILTEVGRSFLSRAEEIVALSDLALSEYTSGKKDIQGELSICFIDRTFSEKVAVPQQLSLFDPTYEDLGKCLTGQL